LNHGYELARATTQDGYPIVYKSGMLNGQEVVENIYVITPECPPQFMAGRLAGP
jgi:hypothetical protein